MTTLTDFEINIPNPCSIAVLTNYRTGSSAVCDWLGKKRGIPNYRELFHRAHSTIQFETYKHAEHCVLKIMPDQFVEPYWSDISERFVLLGLYRKDLAKQAASYYIAGQLQDHEYTKNSKTREIYHVPINIKSIEDTCYVILEYHKEYLKHRPLLTAEVAYEDIEHELDITDWLVHPKPTNYFSILDICQRYLNKVHE